MTLLQLKHLVDENKMDEVIYLHEQSPTIVIGEVVFTLRYFFFFLYSCFLIIFCVHISFLSVFTFFYDLFFFYELFLMKSCLLSVL